MNICSLNLNIFMCGKINFNGRKNIFFVNRRRVIFNERCVISQVRDGACIKMKFFVHVAKCFRICADNAIVNDQFVRRFVCPRRFNGVED